MESTPTPPVQVDTQILPPMTPTATPQCAALPEGMTLIVTPVSSSPAPMVQIEVTGLQPGEQLNLVFYTDVAGQNSTRIEEFPAQPAGPDGHFVMRDQLAPPPGSATTHWQIQIVHSRGVACTEITLP